MQHPGMYSKIIRLQGYEGWRIQAQFSASNMIFCHAPCLSPTCPYSPRPNTLPLPRHLSPHFSSRHSLGWYSSHVRSSEIAFTTLKLSWLSFMAMAKICLLSNHILRKCWAPKRHYVSQQSEMIHIKYSKYCLF